ncbi:Cell division protein FtsL [Austwickia sp. TVS 96-490-7B]|uniref:FtsB family cell division protein n=1 Tax=Austwickia sp. TVS 96-490-7B TaxID=2830843 RepID=UPI001C55E00B|nr:septum formation initiator family protein [Austwickia sp. TVS 96-490-7B]MBW3085632.1 Cell division protein FtsL [Austwickia sp. TVS 96-490-7B]
MASAGRRPGGTTGRGRRTPGARPSPTPGPRARGSAAVRPAGKSRNDAPAPRSKDRSRRTADPVWRISRPTRRAAVLGAILVMMALMLAPTLRSWLDQRSQVEALRDKVRAQQQTLRSLEQEKARWDDPAFVEQQARSRLKVVKPGETGYTVIGVGREAKARQGEVKGSVVAPAVTERMTWYERMWRSVELTDGVGRTTRLGGSEQQPSPTAGPTTSGGNR